MYLSWCSWWSCHILYDLGECVNTDILVTHPQPMNISIRHPFDTTPPHCTDYIGCFMYNTSIVTNSTSHFKHWYEPQHSMLGSIYVTYARGSTYVLSRKALRLLATIPPGGLRYFRSEGIICPGCESMGWLYTVGICTLNCTQQFCV